MLERKHFHVVIRQSHLLELDKFGFNSVLVRW